MAVGEQAVPVEGCEYSVTVGESLLGAGEPSSSVAGHALFQYKFTPASVNVTIPGLVSVDDSGVATVLRGTTAQSFDGAIMFKGKVIEQKDTECLLIFDGSSFRLERCDFALSQLRHIRAAPSQRPPPRGASVIPDKKGPLSSTAERTGKPASSSVRGRRGVPSHFSHLSPQPDETPAVCEPTDPGDRSLPPLPLKASPARGNEEGDAMATSVAKRRRVDKAGE